jgi:hypothetical protein
MPTRGRQPGEATRPVEAGAVNESARPTLAGGSQQVLLVATPSADSTHDLNSFRKHSAALIGRVAIHRAPPGRIVDGPPGDGRKEARPNTRSLQWFSHAVAAGASASRCRQDKPPVDAVPAAVAGSPPASFSTAWNRPACADTASQHRSREADQGPNAVRVDGGPPHHDLVGHCCVPSCRSPGRKHTASKSTLQIRQ